MIKIGMDLPKSANAYSVEEAMKVAKEIGSLLFQELHLPLLVVVLELHIIWKSLKTCRSWN